MIPVENRTALIKCDHCGGHSKATVKCDYCGMELGVDIRAANMNLAVITKIQVSNGRAISKLLVRKFYDFLPYNSVYE